MQIIFEKTQACGAHWLNRVRLRAYSGTILLASLIYLLRCAWHSWKLYGHPNGADFTTFWAASRLWLDGAPLDAYFYPALNHAARQISATLPAPGPFFYPPNFLLLLRPLAWLPSPVSYVVFALATAAAFVLLLRKVLPMRGALLPIIAFPGIWLTTAQGQNSCLTASLALGSLMMLEKRPVTAGICLGMLSIKPHLAILFPIALACAGMWSAFVAAGVTAVLLTCISIFVFGSAAIPAFLHALSLANHAISTGALPWGQTASLFATLRLAHVPLAPAFVAQACSAISAAGVVIWVWRQPSDSSVRATALVAGTCMVSPYIFNYDTTWLGVPVALFTAKALRDGWLRWEREILCIAWLYPGLGDLFGIFLHVGIGPLVAASLLFVSVRRTLVEKSIAAPRESAEPARDQSSGCDTHHEENGATPRSTAEHVTTQ
ncbi:alpha-1,2-mannosyltransferase [Paraburkholderia sp. WSM4175]|uniref:glycosyltransferase family 87 protein n=1 Tax=Paraburkholderia sp. WSM4175 TaxID=2991072 RepID=UPI003D1CC2DE